jgi:Uncharacterised nucleotidyltransferase
MLWSAVAVTPANWQPSEPRGASRRIPGTGPDRVLRVLVAVARCRDVGGSGGLAAALRAADWDRLLLAAEAHGMLGILYRRAVDHCPDALPPAAGEALAAAYRASGKRGLRQEARLREVIERLGEAGMAAVPFKGPVLAQLVYGDVALRYATDLDVLVRAADVAPAAEALVAAGWRRTSEGQAEQHDLLRAAECELLLEHPASGLFLEVHWRTGPRFAHASLPAEPLIDGARPCRLLDREISCLADDDHFLVLCVHGATHRWGQLELICTMAEFVAQGRIDDWSALLVRAARLGCRRRVLVAAALAAGLARVALPQGVAAAIADDRGADRLAWSAAADLQAVPGPLSPGRRLRGLLWQAAVLDTPADRLRHLVARTLVPGGRDLDWFAVPQPLSPVYYVLRPLRLVTHYARRAVRSA